MKQNHELGLIDLCNQGKQFSKKERTAGRSELELPEVDEPGVLVSSPVASVFVARVEVGKVDNKSLES